MRSFNLLSILILAFLAAVAVASSASPVVEEVALAHRSATAKAERRARSVQDAATLNKRKSHRKRKSCKAKGIKKSTGKTKENGVKSNITVTADGKGVLRGICWGMDDRWAAKLQGSMIKWYHHWQDGPNSHLDAQGAEFVPMFWGSRYNYLWNQRKASFNSKLPKHIIAQNEPDVKSQANVDPYTAANDWARELGPWQKRGVKVTTPQIVYDVEWMSTFMKELQKKGYKPDIIALHWYGGSDQISTFKSYLNKVHSRWPELPIWITEMGVTAAGAGSQSQVLSFQREVMNFAQQAGYVKRVAWIGAFIHGQAYDGFMSNSNAFFNGNGISGWARYFLFGNSSNKRDQVYEQAERDAYEASLAARDVVEIPDERNTALLFTE